MEIEKRIYSIKETGLTVEERDGEQPKISGYAAVFNSDSEDLGFRETIKPGAFKKALKKSDVRALYNHDPNYIFGRTGVNLELRADKTGLHMTVDPVPTATYRLVAENIQAGLVSQQSFAFTIAPGGDEWNKDFTRRTITEVDEIFDVSPVTYPAYNDTTVALRSRDLAKGNPTNAKGGAEGAPTSAADVNKIYQRLKRRHEQ